MTNPEFDNFDKAIRKMFSISRDELRRRKEKWKREHKRGKRKLKTSASAHVSHAKG
jgi:hypothetical protein